jgi:hypothetical protein
MWDRVSASHERRLENLVTGIARLREAISRQLEDCVGHSEASEWDTGGTKTSGSRREKSQSIGVRIRESRSAESRGSCGRMAEHKVGPTWLKGGHALPGDKSQHSVEFSHLGDSRNRRVKTRRFNRRGCEVARLRVAKSSREEPA